MRQHPEAMVTNGKADDVNDDTTTPRRTRRRQFGNVRRLNSGRYQARYFDSAGQRHTAPDTFATRADANRWLSTVEADMVRGDWIDPRMRRVTFGEWAEEWLATTAHLAPKTRDGYESLLRMHVLPFFGRYEIGHIEQVHVRRFVSDMQRRGIGAGVVINAYRVVSGVLAAAVGSGALRANPAVGVKLPRRRRVEMQFLTAAQVEDLADAIATPPGRDPMPAYRILVHVAAYTGLRAGEIAGLRVGRINLLRGVIDVVETVVETRTGVLDRQPTKNRQRRTVPIPRFLADELAAHLADRANDPDALVFPAPDGGPHRHSAFYHSYYRPAVRRAGVPPRTRFHDLRHTCAALLIAQGHHPKAIMELMGHSTINVTLDTYGHLFPSLMEAVASGLDAAYRSATSAPTPMADVLPLASQTDADHHAM